MDAETLALAQAVIDGEATVDQECELAARMAQDPALHAEVQALRELVETLGSVPRVAAPPALADEILSRAHQLLPAPAVFAAGRARGSRVNLADTLNRLWKELTMAIQTSLFAGTRIKVLAGSAAAALVVYAVGVAVKTPVDGQDTMGTIAPAQRVQATQVTAADVKLGDQQVAQIMQTDAYRQLVADPAFREAMKSSDFRMALQSRDFQRVLQSDAAMKLLSNASFQQLMANNAARAIFSSDAMRLAMQDDTAAAALRSADADLIARSSNAQLQQLSRMAGFSAMLNMAAFKVLMAQDSALLARSLETASVALRSQQLMAAMNSPQMMAALTSASFANAMKVSNMSAALQSQAFMQALSVDSGLVSR